MTSERCTGRRPKGPELGEAEGLTIPTQRGRKDQSRKDGQGFGRKVFQPLSGRLFPRTRPCEQPPGHMPSAALIFSKSFRDGYGHPLFVFARVFPISGVFRTLLAKRLFYRGAAVWAKGRGENNVSNLRGSPKVPLRRPRTSQKAYWDDLGSALNMGRADPT